MSDAKKLNLLTVPKLKKLLVDEQATLPKKGSGLKGRVLKKDIIATILKNRKNKKGLAPTAGKAKEKAPLQPDYLSDLPIEMRVIISSGLDPADIPASVIPIKNSVNPVINHLFGVIILANPLLQNLKTYYIHYS